MGNALSNLANSLFNRRQAPQDQQGMQSTIPPNPNILGSGMARNAANGLLMHEYQTKLAIAQASGDEFPTFEQWLAMRQ